MRGHRFLAGLLAAGLVLCGARAWAAPSAAAVAAYTGTDRQQRLEDGGKREGELNLYTSAQGEDIGSLIAAFEKRYGIKVNVWRSSSEKVLQRAVVEARGQRHTMDVAETNGPELESLHREKLLVAVKSPYLADLIAPAIRPHGEWVGTRLNVFVQAYNTQLVKKSELPATWEELSAPGWKGKLGIEQQDADWLAGQSAELGEPRARAVFGDIVRRNGISVRKGHTLLTQLVASGEIAMALTVYSYKAEQLKRKGAPIDWFRIGPAIARANGVGVAKQAPHPHAAVLFYDFEISPEGQGLLAARDFVPTSRRVDAPLDRASLRIVDARVLLDESGKWERLYDELFARQR